MAKSWDYPLNPVDHVLLATHESLRQRGYCGLPVMLIAEVEGPLDPAAMRLGLQRLARDFPALSARLRLTPILRRAYWHIDADAPFEQAVEYEHHVFDPATQDVDGPLRCALHEEVELAHGQHLRLVHVQTTPTRHRLGLRWAHPLMDMEGGHLLLRELQLALCDEPTSLGRDPTAVHRRPFKWAFPGSFFRVWQGRALHAYHCTFRQPRLIAKPDDQRRTVNFEVRRYPAALRRKFEAAAKSRVSEGPMRYTRALMIAVARTYQRMARERGRPRDHYLLSQALPVPRSDPRPGVHGNHVTIPWFVFASDDLGDWSRSDAVVARQFREYFTKHRDRAVWEMFRAASRWPLAASRFVTTHRIPRGAVGCTGYRFDESVTQLGSAKIINLYGVGSMNCHPGWIIGHTTFGDSMTLSTTFVEDHVDAVGIRQFMDMLEVELFEVNDGGPGIAPLREVGGTLLAG